MAYCSVLELQWERHGVADGAAAQAGGQKTPTSIIIITLLIIVTEIHLNGENCNNINNGNRVNGGNSNWQHNPEHRGGAPDGDRGTANKYGGTTRGDSMITCRKRPAERGAPTTRRRREQSRRRQCRQHERQPWRSERRQHELESRHRREQRRKSAGTQHAEFHHRSAFGGAGSGTSGGQARASQSRGSSSRAVTWRRRFPRRRRRRKEAVVMRIMTREDSMKTRLCSSQILAVSFALYWSCLLCTADLAAPQPQSAKSATATAPKAFETPHRQPLRRLKQRRL